MKTKGIAISFLAVLLLLVTSDHAFSYGYGTAGEDPLITMFKEIVVEAKQEEKDWGIILNIVEDAKKPIENLDDFFGTKLYKKFSNAIETKDINLLISATVNLVYLSMMEKFELVKNKGFKDYNFSKGRLALNDKYYREIFKGNVVKYDMKHGTGLNDKIVKDLSEIQATIGKPGKFGMKGEPAHPDDYDRLYKSIKKNLKTVFTFFEG